MKQDTAVERQVRLARLLNLLSYLSQHPDRSPMEIARDIGTDAEQVKSDLAMLHLSGVGNGPGEMIDLKHSWTEVTVIDDQGLSRPLRLTPTEANTLLLLLDSFETMPGLLDQAALSSAAEKLRAVVGSTSVLDADGEQSDQESILGILQSGLQQGVQVQVTYFSPSSDTLRERQLTGIRFFHQGGHTYFTALDGGEEKSFRTDRIREARLTEVPADRSAVGKTFDGSDPFGFDSENIANLLVSSDATWLADYWEIEIGDAYDDGRIEATMVYGSADWLIRFCLSQGDRIELIGPPELADEARRRAFSGLEALE